MQSPRRNRRWPVAALVAIGIGAASTGALADLGPPHVIAVPNVKEEIKTLKEAPQKAVDDAKKQAKTAVDDALDGGLSVDAGSDAGADAGDAGRADGGDDPSAEDDRQTAEWAKTRDVRAARSRLGVRRELDQAGNPPMDDALRAELKLHARRVAWLDRIGFVASRTDDKASQETVKRLLSLEGARHTAWLSAHTKGGAP
jgi:hypothetical protein